MARKKAVRKKAVAKTNPAVSLKSKLEALNADLKKVKTDLADTIKRTSALIKAETAAPAKPKAKAPAKKKTAKKRRKVAKKSK
ncbi:MAG: hypothetical protein OEY43_06170 [Gammaproteobacteria bacterium]|nr:hypothetical protein [Gammaproteobacteria bacterium]